MENALIIMTIVSAAIALVMTAIVIKMLFDERRRSEARVEALVRLASQAGAPSAVAVETPSASALGERRPVAPADDVAGPDLAYDVFATEPADEMGAPASVAGVGGLFAEPEQSSPWFRRLGIAASIAVLAGIIGFGAPSLTPAAGEEAPEPAGPVPAEASATLELLSLTHENRGDSLTITGVVQNPRTNAFAIAGVQATAVLFASNGSVIATGRAPLDFSRLQPGDESPFVLRLPVRGGVARFRVGFRAQDGRVIEHIDRRAAGPLARNE
jgi:hypothetical protein